jgi:hypothetical protein
LPPSRNMWLQHVALRSLLIHSSSYRHCRQYHTTKIPFFASEKSQEAGLQEQQQKQKPQQQKKQKKTGKEASVAQQEAQQPAQYMGPSKPYIIASPPLSGEWILATEQSPKLPIPDIRQMNNTEWRRFGGAQRVRLMAIYHKIFPDLFNEFTPRINMVIEYPNDVLVHRGNYLTPTQTKEQPTVTYRVAVPRWWSLMMVDLDVPTPYEPIARTCVHWLIGNIPGSKVALGEVLAEYFPPAPPHLTGAHRYVFALLEQRTGRVTYDVRRINAREFASRTHFDVRKWMKKYSLLPKGLAFFQSSYDESVPEIYAERGVEPLLPPSQRKKRAKFSDQRYFYM